MKRADLIVGQDYLVNGSPDWEQPDHYRSRRYRILDLRGWTESKSWHPRAELVQVAGATYRTMGRQRDGEKGILAQRLDDAGGVVVGGFEDASVIQPGQVRLPWSEWEPRRDAMREHDRQVKERRQREQARAATRLQFAQDRLQTIIPGATLADVHADAWAIRADVLEALLERVVNPA